MAPTVDTNVPQEFPLLRALSPDQIADIAPFLSERRFSAGELIASEGDYCDGGYYLVSGQVEVRFLPASRPASSRTTAQPVSWRDRLRGVFSGGRAAAPPDRERGVLVPEVGAELGPGGSAVLEPGDIFAAESALSRFPLATDIVALTDVRAVLIRTQGLRKMLDQPELSEFKQHFDRSYRDRVLRAHLRRVSLFRDLDQGAIERLVAVAELVTFKPDNEIAKQGAPADAFYLVRGGYVKVGVEVGRSIVAASYLRKGDWVGETGVLLDEPWPFSLTAIEHVELVKFSRENLRRALGRGEHEGELWKTLATQLKRVARTVADPMTAQPLQYSTDSGLIHGESVLLIDLETCTRCDECVRACADVHDGTPRFVREGSRLGHYSVVTACFHCTDPVCMIPCPTGAISRPLGTREVAIDRDTCIGCGRCVRRCPWGNILQVPYDSPTVGKKIDLASKCDLCLGRAAGPACVQMCPHGAAVRVDFKEDDQIEALFSRL
jgi:CRP-like cAMP-binding protein/Fe-S-cluster-containing hydrogenase component 2